jgi:uncharacterized protein YjbI with pentapeptide repeats
MASATLTLADLRYATLFRADMRNVIADRVYFLQADMRGANLSGAILVSSSFESADLADVDLSRANLESANFAGTNLYNVIFTGARMPDSTVHP